MSEQQQQAKPKRITFHVTRDDVCVDCGCRLAFGEMLQMATGELQDGYLCPRCVWEYGIALGGKLNGN